MKKITLILAVICACCISCDKEHVHEYHIKNSCNEEIEILLGLPYYREGYTVYRPFNLLPMKDTVVYVGISYMRITDDFEIKLVFDSMDITKNDQPSNINFIDNSLWVFNQENKYKATYTLTVKPEYFD